MNTRGSEWARWDLHVHTPHSIIQGYGEGGVDPWEAFLADLESLPAEFRVVGVNDYLFLDGYIALREAKKAGRIPNIELLLPVLEFRLNHFGGTDGDLSRINLHVIFSDDLASDLIQSQFINGLKCDLTLSPGNDHKSDWASILTKQSLISLGAAVKAAMPDDIRANAASDLIEGFNNYNVGFDQMVALLDNPLFRNKFFLAIGKTEWADVKWTKQSAAFKKTLINRPHLVFTAADTLTSFTKSRQALISRGVNATLLDCSDAHHLSNSSHKDRIGNCMTWINAARSFEGLRHAYYEYDTRVFVGECPPKLEASQAHPTHHLSGVRVHPVADDDPKPRFDVDIPLNAGFVAIVGNKGKGKSALTDIIGFLGDSSRFRHYSFLTKTRFRDPKANLASRHVGQLTWMSHVAKERNLDMAQDLAAYEAVQYLPQNFLETVCNEGPGSDVLFSSELGDVIFSHVPEEDRLGAATLQGLVEARTLTSYGKIAILREELSVTLRQIADLEKATDPTARRALNILLGEKIAELEAHDKVRPTEVARPEEVEDGNSDSDRLLESVRKNIVLLESELRTLQVVANEKSVLVQTCANLGKELDNFDHQYASFLARVRPMAEALGLKLEDLIILRTYPTVVESLARRLIGERQDAINMLAVTTDGSPAQLLAAAGRDLTDLENALAAPRRAYQSYLSDLVAWERLRMQIIGEATIPDTLEYVRQRIAQLATVPDRLLQLRSRRDTHAKAIHAELLTICATLREIYGPVQKFIDEHPVVRDRFNLSFEVTIVEHELSDRLFAMINRQVNGSFAGTHEGAAYLEEIVASTDFNSPDGVGAFLTQLADDLHHDNRPGRDRKEIQVHDQLRKAATVQGVYELIFGLDYLSPTFWLRSGEMPISQLSPGQRGTLLLLFYLLVEKTRRPIIMDQPEENLDNQTVHELLVPAIAEARRTRQVIVVTHNPNLAVVGDADQIVVAELDIKGFHYLSGAIEDGEINGRIIDILEGTWPAFENRRDKYIPTAVLEALG